MKQGRLLLAAALIVALVLVLLLLDRDRRSPAPDAAGRPPASPAAAPMTPDGMELPVGPRSLAAPEVPKAMLRVALRDARGAPLAGTLTMAIGGAEGPIDFPIPAAAIEVTIGSGTPIDLTADAAGHTRATAGPLQLFPGERRELEMVLEDGRLVSGTVVGERGEAITDARVAIRLAGESAPLAAEPPPPIAETAATGPFQLRSVPRLPLELSVSADGYANRTVVVTALDDVTALTIALVRPEPLQGLVLDDQGHPIAGARVIALAADEQSASSDLATTLQDGAFQLARLRPGYATVRAQAPGFVPQVKTQVATLAPRLRFALNRCGSLRGIAPGAEPFEVWLFRPQQTGEDFSPGALLGHHGFRGLAPRFEIRDLIPGSLLVQVRSARGWVELRPIEVRPGEVAGPIEVMQGAAGSITGSVGSRAPGAGTVPPALVRLLPAVPFSAAAPPVTIPERCAIASIGGAARFTLGAIAPGDYQIEVLAAGHAPHRQSVLVTAGNTTDLGAIELAPGGDVIVRIGDKLAGERLSLEIAAGSASFSAEREGPRRHAFRHLAPGTYEVRAYRIGDDSRSIFQPRPIARQQVTVEPRADGSGSQAVEIEIGG